MKSSYITWSRRLVLVAAALMLVLPWTALAGQVDVAVVDVDVPTNSVTLAPGQSAEITITATVSKQLNCAARFSVYSDWTLSDGAFAGSGQVDQGVGARSASDPDDVFQFAGTVTVAPSQAPGVYTLTAEAFDFQSDCEPGLKAQGVSQYVVTVSSAPPADTTAPATTFAASGDEGDNGWYTGDVTVELTASDEQDGSGVAEINYRVDGGDWVTEEASYVSFTLSEDGTHTVEYYAVDNAGNVEETQSQEVKIDQTAPVLNVSGAASGTYELCGGAPTRPSFDPTDATSGVLDYEDSWTPSSVPSGVGSYTYEAWAVDYAGNEANEVRTYDVVYGQAFSGFLPPLATTGKGHFKLGSTIPVKFSLSCGDGPIDNATARLFVRKLDNYAEVGEYVVVSTSAATAGNYFRYDSTAGQYIFNLSTKAGYVNPDGTTVSAFTSGTWRLAILLDDGSYHTIDIDLR